MLLILFHWNIASMSCNACSSRIRLMVARLTDPPIMCSTERISLLGTGQGDFGFLSIIHGCSPIVAPLDIFQNHGGVCSYHSINFIDLVENQIVQFFWRFGHKLGVYV